MRVAFVHDWLVTYRGGEKVLAALLSLYPEAPLYTLFYDPQRMPLVITQRQVIVPRLLNSVRPLRKMLLPLLPQAIEALPLQNYDLLISTSSCVAKGARKGPGARHLCYIHSPMRYIWDQQAEYLAGVAHIPGAQAAIKALTPRLQRWDIASAARVDRFVANSSFVRDRVRRLYGLDAAVVPPPIELARFEAREQGAKQGYLLAAGALVSYKRFDLAIAACASLGRKLIIAGAGPLEGALRAQVGACSNVEISFEISPSDERFAELLAGADALLFPGVEDFGMIAIEAMAAGTPVIAYAEGGARDFIVEGQTGAFFSEARDASLAAVIAAFRPENYAAGALRAFAASFSEASFLQRMRGEIAALMDGVPA